MTLKKGVILQFCGKHDRKKKDFYIQAAKAGKASELQEMEEYELPRFIELFENFCSCSERRGRPADCRKFDWNVIAIERTGKRDMIDTPSSYLCEADFIAYFTSDAAPAYQRHLD